MSRPSHDDHRSLHRLGVPSVGATNPWTYPFAGLEHQLKLLAGNMKSSISTKARCRAWVNASAPGRRLLSGAVVITMAPKRMADCNNSAMSPFRRVLAPAHTIVHVGVELEWSGVQWSGVGVFLAHLSHFDVSSCQLVPSPAALARAAGCQ